MNGAKNENFGIYLYSENTGIKTIQDIEFFFIALETRINYEQFGIFANQFRGKEMYVNLI